MAPMKTALVWVPWILGCSLYIGAAAAAAAGRLPQKWFWAGRCVADVLMLVWYGLRALSGDGGGSAWAGLYVVLLVWDYGKWRQHRDDDDDDDDWGKRLRSWTLSHIPRPVIVPLRPAQVAGAAA